MSALAPLAVAVPLLASALVAAATTLHPRRVTEGIAIATALVSTGIATVLLVRSTDQPIIHWFGGWEPREGVALGIDFAVDPFGAGFALLVGVLTTATFVYSWHYFDELGQTLFYAQMLFLAAMTGLALTGDLFNMFVFFELATVPAIVLTGYLNEELGPLQGAIGFAVTNTLGAFLVLTGIALLYGRTGALNLGQIGETLAGKEPDGLVVTAFALLVVGFLVKSAIVPFHFWLSDAYAVAPTPVLVVFAGAMSELGLFAVARVYWTAFDGTLGGGADAIRDILVGAGILTALVGALMCAHQTNVKRLLAYATIAHAGLFLIGIALLNPSGLAGAAIWITADGLVKGSLFMAAGIVVTRLGAVDERELHGRGRRHRLTGALFALGGLALATAPPFGTFLGKALVEEAGSRTSYGWLTLVFVLVSALVGGSVLRAAARIFGGWGDVDRAHERAGEEAGGEPAAGTGRVPAFMLAPAGLLLASALVLGVTPGLASRADRAAERFQDREAYAAHVLQEQEPEARALEPSGPKPKHVLASVAAVAGAVAIAAASLFRRRLGRAARAAAVPMNALAALHSGHVGDYVAWLTIGAAAFGVLFAVGLG